MSPDPMSLKVTLFVAAEQSGEWRTAADIATWLSYHDVPEWRSFWGRQAERNLALSFDQVCRE